MVRQIQSGVNANNSQACLRSFSRRTRTRTPTPTPTPTPTRTRTRTRTQRSGTRTRRPRSAALDSLDALLRVDHPNFASKVGATQTMEIMQKTTAQVTNIFSTACGVPSRMNIARAVAKKVCIHDLL